ncbi:hypothetical protein M231_05473 [Tremella mesenterica]|uniref:F-box domain-containing protein n=1 Tax=Tremella mesenterica TaxID=5217 RepID=A0A4Q1BI09_TREME|nr:hypothetical protein M231_05473 [Tremella mesenterica]
MEPEPIISEDSQRYPTCIIKSGKTIDHFPNTTLTAYPHLLSLIFTFCDNPTLLSLQLASSSFLPIASRILYHTLSPYAPQTYQSLCGIPPHLCPSIRTSKTSLLSYTRLLVLRPHDAYRCQSLPEELAPFPIKSNLRTIRVTNVDWGLHPLHACPLLFAPASTIVFRNVEGDLPFGWLGAIGETIKEVILVCPPTAMGLCVAKGVYKDVIGGGVSGWGMPKLRKGVRVSVVFRPGEGKWGGGEGEDGEGGEERDWEGVKWMLSPGRDNVGSPRVWDGEKKQFRVIGMERFVPSKITPLSQGPELSCIKKEQNDQTRLNQMKSLMSSIWDITTIEWITLREMNLVEMADAFDSIELDKLRKYQTFLSSSRL